MWAGVCGCAARPVPRRGHHNVPRGTGLVAVCVRRCPTLPHPGGCSTIGVGSLSFRVRNGSGRWPSRYDHRDVRSGLVLIVLVCGSGWVGRGPYSGRFTPPPAAPARAGLGGLLVLRAPPNRPPLGVGGRIGVVCVWYRPISTGQLQPLQVFHVRPINPMVCGGPGAPHQVGCVETSS